MAADRQKPPPEGMPKEIGLRDAAGLLGLSTRWVQLRSDEGWFEKTGRGRYPFAGLIRGVVAYYEAQRKEQSAKAAADRGREARAREIEQRMAIKAGELIPYADAHGAMTDLAGAVDSILNGLPAKIAKGADERARVRGILDEARSRIVERLGEAGAALGDGGAAYRAAAGDEPERVGGGE